MRLRGVLLALALTHVAAAPLPAASAPTAAGGAEDVAAARHAAEAIDPAGKPDEAEAAWLRVIALERARPRPDAAAIATALGRIGDARYYKGKPDLALAVLEEARDTLERAGLGESDAMAETLSNLGVMRTALGRPQEDLALQRRALAIGVKLHGADDPRLALNYFNLGNALYELGLAAEAADNIERGLGMRLATMKPDNPDLFMSLASASAIDAAAGRLNLAVDHAQQAVELVTRHHPGHPYTGFVRGVLGKALVNAGRASEAAEVNRLAMDELAASMGRDHPLTLAAMANLATSLARLGRFEEALALQLGSIPKDRDSVAADTLRSWVSASNFAAEAGDESQALAIARQGYDFARARLPENHAVRAQITEALALHLERQGEKKAALELMREAVPIFARSEDRDSGRALAAEINLGALEIATGAGEQGYARVGRAATLLRTAMLASVDSPELGSWDNGYYESFARAAEAAVRFGKPADAFRYAQLANYDVNAQASQQVALRNAAGRGSKAAGEVRSLQDALAGLRMLNVQKAALLASGKLEPLKDVNRSIAAAERQILSLRARLESEVPGFDRLSRPETVELAAVQARLDPSEALLIALPSRMGTTLLLVRRDRVGAETSPIARSGFRAKVDSLRDSIDRSFAAEGGRLGPFDAAASHALYRALFSAALEKEMRGVSHLHLMTAGPLAKLPFALLVRQPPPKTARLRELHWLVKDMSFDVPVSLAQVGREQGGAAHPIRFAGIGAPALSGAPSREIKLASLYRNGRADIQKLRELPALPGAAAELRRMRDALRPKASLLLIGPDASEAKLRGEPLSDYSVLAFATHGLVAGEMNGLDEPALVLTPPATAADAANDGLLTISEIAGLKLDADWVVLSACNTAAGATRDSPPYTGLAHAFLYAGAKSLLISHWQVRDDAAARLSTDTVARAGAGLDPAEALRRAMLALIADPKVPDGAHPAIWAPFILIRQ